MVFGAIGDAIGDAVGSVVDTVTGSIGGVLEPFADALGVDPQILESIVMGVASGGVAQALGQAAVDIGLCELGEEVSQQLGVDVEEFVNVVDEVV